MLGARLPGSTGMYGFAVYMLSGFIVWGLFADTLNRTTTIFLEYGNHIKKVVFPKVVPVAIGVGVAMSNFLVLFAIALVFLAAIGKWPGFMLLNLIPATLCVILLGLGIGLICGVLNVFMRDIGQVVSIIMTFWFWLTPIIYQLNALPKAVKTYVELNPMTPIVQSFQSVLLLDTAPDFASLISPVVIGVIALALGVFMLRRASAQMPDAL
jgi:lipopolysaccharide transport system permease protein